MPVFPAIGAVLSAIRKHATLALLALALLASAIFAFEWRDARRSAAQLAATLAAQQKIISDADARQSARDATLTQTLAQITALEQAVKTPQQASAALAQSLPQFVDTSTGALLPAPLQFIPFANASPAATAAQQSLPPEAPAQQGTATSGISSSTSASANPSPAPSTTSAPSNSLSPKSQGASQSNALSSAPHQNVVILSAAKDHDQSPQLEPQSSGQPASPKNSATSANPAVPEPLGALSYLKSQIASVASRLPGASSAPAANNSAAPPNSSATSSAATPGGVPSVNASAAQLGTTASPIPGSICIPPPDLKPLYDSIENCEACAAKLTASQADLADETSKFTAATTQRDAALRAARGTFWTRTARAAKWIAIGAAAGALLARYH